jgi:hypothetical protein
LWPSGKNLKFLCAVTFTSLIILLFIHLFNYFSLSFLLRVYLQTRSVKCSFEYISLSQFAYHKICVLNLMFRLCNESVSRYSNSEFNTGVYCQAIYSLCFPTRSVLTRINKYKRSVTTQQFICINNKIVYMSGQHVSTLHWVIFRPNRNTDPRTICVSYALWDPTCLLD